MPWIQQVPANAGGGRKQQAPTGKVYSDGQFAISHAAAAMLGAPERVLVFVEPELEAIRVQPTTPEHKGAFSLAGGGNSPHRISLRRAIKTYPQLEGEYAARKIAGGIEFRKKTENA